MPDQPTQVVIIGAGAGGTALAVYLAQQGFQVQVLEKQPAAGGRCGQILREGHRFDLGATLMLMPRLFASIFRDWGENIEDHLKLQPLDPLYRLFFEKSGRLDFTSDLRSLHDQLEAREPGSFESFLRYLRLGSNQYRDLMGLFLGRNFKGPWDYFNPANLYQFVNLQAHRNYFRLTRRFFKHPELLAAFSFQNIYVGQSPFASSAAYCLLPAMELAYGGWYPQGGMHKIIQAMAGLAERHGVRFRFNAPVEKILLRQGRAAGVRLAGGEELPADWVISNADLPYTNRMLLPPEANAARKNWRYSCSAVVFHWGLNRPLPELGHHNVFLAQNYRGGFDGIFKERTFGDPPHFYVNRPTCSEPAAAPAGQDTLSAIVPSGHHDPRHPQDWEKLKDRARSAVLDRLRQAGLPALEPHLKFEIAYAPPDWERGLNLTRGAVFGSLDHGLTQVGYLRPGSRHPRCPNLFFVGGSTHPGSGVPLTLLSARLTAERLLAAAGRLRPAWGRLEF